MKCKLTKFYFILIAFFFAGNLSSQSFLELDKKVEAFYKQAKWDSALYYSEKSVIAAEKEMGKKDTSVALAYYNVGTFNKRLGKYDKALKSLNEAISRIPKDQDKGSKVYTKCLNGIANVYLEKADFDKTEEYYLKSAEIRKKELGDSSFQYAESLNNLSKLYQSTGSLDKAEQYSKLAVKNTKKVEGSDGLNYAITLNTLANLYQTMNKFEKAEPLLIESMNIRLNKKGKDSPEYAEVLNNLGALYEEMGNYEKAETYYLNSVAIKKKVYGEKHLEYAIGLNNLAGNYRKMKNYGKSLPLFKEAIEIRREKLGEENLTFASSLNNLAFIYWTIKDYKKADSLYTLALSIYKKTVGENHPNYAAGLNNLGRLYTDMKYFDKAEDSFKEALRVRKAIFGELSPRYAETLNSLAYLYYVNNKYSDAEPIFLENLDVRLKNIQSNFSFLSEAEKEKYWNTMNNEFEVFYSFAAKRKKENPAIVGEMLNNRLATKGMLFNSTVSIKNSILSSNDTVLISKYNKWIALKEKIGVFSNLSKSELKKRGIKLDSLGSLANYMEKQLSQQSDVFASEREAQTITWKQVQNNLNPKEAVIEYFQFHYTDNSNVASDSTVYYAVVLRKNYKYPRLVYLCGEKQLSEMVRIKEVQVNYMFLHLSGYVGDKDESKAIYKLIFGPLDSMLNGSNQVYLSLAGLLNRVSFKAVMDTSSVLLIDKYDFHLINNSKALASRKNQPNEKGNNTIQIFGGIDYNTPIDTMIKVTTKCSKTSVTFDRQAISNEKLSGLNWDYLDGTLSEAHKIEQLFAKNKWKTKLDTGARASEETFKKLNGKSSPQIIHISTHGFFCPDPRGKNITSENSESSFRGNVFQRSINPLLRSGLMFSGGNRVWEGGSAVEGIDDGVLTAYEVANTFLGGTDVVVLSACETGLGDIKSGEGVYGLQRSFQIAGAKALIMSLWQVPDAETVELMETFYNNWLQLGDMHEAFNKAQLTLSKKYPPFYWAAFQMVENF